MGDKSAIFVFGSNLAGKHYGGAAREAFEQYGAQMDVAEGRTGNTYAIPTMDEKFHPLSLQLIRYAIDRFTEYAAKKPDLRFNLTHIGCGIAGYNWDRDIRSLFPNNIPKNITILEPI